MKRLVREVLGLLGLVTAGRHAMVVEQLHAAEGRSKKIAQQMDQVRGDTRKWKAEAEEAGKRVKEAKAEQQRQAERFEKIRTEMESADKERAEKLRRTVAEASTARDGQIQELTRRLAATERDLAVAREHLMTIEVKLDILEGAANVLDGRTRSVLTRQGSGVGAPV